jgi:peptidoglycan hydrolase-like protein with peptidoglycan-binding domain
MLEVRLGHSGATVNRLQQALQSAGYYIGTEAGMFGPHTDAAIRYLQSCHGLTIDGVAGVQTLTVLGFPVGPVLQVELKLAVVEVVAGRELVVTVRCLAPSGRAVRVVGWFRSAGTEGHSEAIIDASHSEAREARLALPETISSSTSAFKVTVYVFDAEAGTQLEETTASFPSQRPDPNGHWPY